MPQPTTAIYFSESFPAAPEGNQLCLPQTDNAVPEQSVTFYPQVATADLLGVGKPDGETLQVDENGVWSIIPGSTGPGSGGGTGGSSASSGWLVCVVPTGSKDGSNTQFTLPAPVFPGSGYFYVRNGVTQRQLGTKAEFSVQGTILTTLTPLAPDDWHEFYYVMGTPNSESGGSGGVSPVGPAALRSTGSGASNTGSSVTIPFPTGTQVGDLVVVFVGSPSTPGVPSGWTTNYSTVVPNWLAIVCSKVMTSSDISTGSVTVSWAGSFFNTYQVASFIGPTNGIRETDGQAGVNNTGMTTSGAVVAGDIALFFGSGRATGGTVAVCTVNQGTLDQQASDGIIASSCLYSGSVASSGALGVTFSYSTGVFSQQAIVIVKGS